VFGETGVPVDVRLLAERFDVPLLQQEEGDTGRPIFAYHMQYQIVTKNEARQRLGLPPVVGGNVFPQAVQRPTTTHLLAAPDASGDEDPVDRAVALAQAENDDEMGAVVSDVVEALDEADGYDDTHARLGNQAAKGPTEKTRRVTSALLTLLLLLGFLSAARPALAAPRFTSLTQGLRWAHGRAPVSPALQARAQRYADTIAALARPSVIQWTMGAIGSGRALGLAYAEAARSAGDRARSLWLGPSALRAASLYLTPALTAYAAGRHSALSSPEALAATPFWLLRVVWDSHTSDICRPLLRTVLPAGDPWWDTHIPPLHHECRTTIVPLTAKQAVAMGISSRPRAVASEGFGRIGDFGLWTPDPSDYDTLIRKHLSQRPQA
jgi:hypothetical protein